MNEQTHMLLSRWLDGDCSKAEQDALVNRLSRDDEALNDAGTYQMIGDVLRADASDVLSAPQAFLNKLHARLDLDDGLDTSKAHASLSVPGVKHKPVVWPWAVAASVLLAVAFGVWQVLPTPANVPVADGNMSMQAQSLEAFDDSSNAVDAVEKRLERALRTRETQQVALNQQASENNTQALRVSERVQADTQAFALAGVQSPPSAAGVSFQDESSSDMQARMNQYLLQHQAYSRASARQGALMHRSTGMNGLVQHASFSGGIR